MNTVLPCQRSNQISVFRFSASHQGSISFTYFQSLRNQLEEKRMLVEGSLETGRMYIREEGLEDKRLSTDSGEGNKYLSQRIFIE